MTSASLEMMLSVHAISKSVGGAVLELDRQNNRALPVWLAALSPKESLAQFHQAFWILLALGLGFWGPGAWV